MAARGTSAAAGSTLECRYGLPSLNHPVSADQNCRRNGDGKLGGRFQIECQYETRWLLDRQIGRDSTLQNRIGECGGAPVALVEIGPER